MQLAILHHHLNRGGVTSVIANHLRSLAKLPEADRPERVVVLYDGQQDGWTDDLPSELSIALVEEPALAYDAADAGADPEKLADILSDRFDACGVLPGDTLLHVHNHALGKNASLPRALEHLAGDGWRMLLQVHDFAEDNRPENYRHLQQAIGVPDADELGSILYPQAPSIHYATLTERDADILRAAGFAEDRLHTLPNPVADFGEMPSQEEARSRVLPALGLPAQARLVIYPVRGIRRKNLGEMLLLSALAPEGTYFVVTLAPKNPAELASFDRWRRLAGSLDLPCCFDSGGAHGCDFKDTLAAADAILTTSVAEGFGMVFLEAWLAGKPLLGRDLPEITREFKAAGMKFDGMWEELRAAGNLDEDFGRLTPAEQVELIRGTKRVDPPLDLGLATAEANIEGNAAIVRDVYSLERLGERLSGVYGSIGPAGEDAGPAISGSSIVEHFADPSRQYPVRIESFAPRSFAPSKSSTPAQVIFNLSQQLDPEPTDEEPALAKLPGIRAVVFDVYGTLLVSGSGDISLASEGSRGAAALEALQAIESEPGSVSSRSAPGTRVPPGADASRLATDGDAIVEALHRAVHAAHAASASDHPEVEIRELWRIVMDAFQIELTDTQIERFAVEYECRVNPIWPMPGLAETLDGLRSAGKKLGIVSNAQFFTPLAFEPLTGKPLARWGLDDPTINVWSYEHREAKPGTFLYERCAEGLATGGIRPEEALFVGNDLRNDVWPAQQVGFKTALFAGDARSLRWRRDDDRLIDVQPDLLVTDLRQLVDCVD